MNLPGRRLSCLSSHLAQAVFELGGERHCGVEALEQTELGPDGLRCRLLVFVEDRPVSVRSVGAPGEPFGERYGGFAGDCEPFEVWFEFLNFLAQPGDVKNFVALHPAWAGQSPAGGLTVFATGPAFTWKDRLGGFALSVRQTAWTTVVLISWAALGVSGNGEGLLRGRTAGAPVSASFGWK